ncbi:MAG TPA: NDP-sugar synthase [Candidatus Baltobacteraceae bacterium]
MKAMILAGGLSTRLYPLTRQVPKALVPIAGEPNCGHVMRYLRSFGIEDVAINIHYHADAVRSALGDGSPYGVHLNYLFEEQLLGSAGAVGQMKSFFDETFVVVGCDDLTDLNLEALVAFHRERQALATIALVWAGDVTQYGAVVVDETGRIVEFQEKPPAGTEKSNLVNTGIYVFEPEIFKYIERNEFVDFGKNVFPQLQQEKAAFYGLHMQGAYWCDIGTPGEYRRATNDVLSGRVRLLGNARASGVPANAILGDDVRIEGDVRVGERARIGNGVRIAGPSVLGDDVVIGENAEISGSIVWDKTRIGPRAKLVDSIVGINYEIAADTTLEGKIVANEPAEVPR